MAAAVLSHRIATREIPAEIRSGGWLEGGYPCPPGVAEALAGLGIEAPPHLSRTLETTDIERADLILTMERRHVRQIVAETPEAWPRTFTFKEFVQRASAAPRHPGESTPEWLARVGAGRTITSMMGTSPDDIADPYGKTPKDYLRTAEELDGLAAALIELAWPQ